MGMFCFTLFLIRIVSSLGIGADISLLPEYQDAKAIFQDQNGKDIDVLPYLKQKGFNYVRCRLFVNPSLNTETGQDLDYVIKFGKQIKSQGFDFLLDFHYSDSWADPGKQTKPSAWKNLGASQLPSQVYSYTKSSLQGLKDANVVPDMIQIGNEITAGMLWNDGRVGVWSEEWNTDSHWNLFLELLTQASKACREIFPNAKICVHTERSGDSESSKRYYDKLTNAKIDFDVIGLSYYPFWHGTLSDLGTTLTMIQKNYPQKDVIIAEVAYPYNDWGYPDDSKYQKEYASTPEGQAQFTKAFVQAVKKYSNVKGIFWWFVEETYSPNRKITTDLHRGLFSNQNGKSLPALDEFVRYGA